MGAFLEDIFSLILNIWNWAYDIKLEKQFGWGGMEVHVDGPASSVGMEPAGMR